MADVDATTHLSNHGAPLVPDPGDAQNRLETCGENRYRRNNRTL
jgi:hypothetical protein